MYHPVTRILTLLLAALAVSGCTTVKRTVCGDAAASAPTEQAAHTDLDAAPCAGISQTPKAEPAATDAETRADEPSEPRAIAANEVTFESKGDELHGTIDRPETIAGPRPAVLILHDAGPLNRHGLFHGALGLELPVEVAVYRELAENLAQNGYVVMRYDKRTCVTGGPAWCDYPRSYLDGHRETLASTLLSDAAAAIGALRKRPDVDPTEIYLLGHGQGAELALALSERVDARGLVLLAPNPAPVDELILHQTKISIAHLKKRRAAEANTTMGAMLQKQLDALQKSHDEQKKLFAKLRQDKLDDEDVLGAPASTWKGLFELHDRAMASAKNSKTPVLAVFGEQDLNLPTGSAATFQKHLARARNSEVMLMPKLTHVMVAMNARQEEAATRVSEDVQQAILHFFEQLDAEEDQSDTASPKVERIEPTGPQKSAALKGATLRIRLADAMDVSSRP